MAVFMVDAEKAKGNASTIKSQKNSLQSYSRQIISIANRIQIGNEDKQIKRQLKKISELVNENAKECENLGNALIEIASLYQKTEKEIVDGKFNKENSTKANASMAKDDGNSNKKEDDQKDIIEQLKEKFNLSDIAIEALKLILGLIPGVNCIIDMYDLVKDVSDALEDGKLSAGEIFSLAVDTFSLVADVASFGALLKSMESVADGIKVAKTGGAADKLCNVAKKTDSIKNGIKNTVAQTKGGNKILDAADKAKKFTDKAEKMTDNASKIAVKKIITDAGDEKIRKTVTKKTADYIADRSLKSKTVYSDAAKAAEKYTGELMDNIYKAPKDFVKGKIKDKVNKKVEDFLDGKKQSTGHGGGGYAW